MSELCVIDDCEEVAVTEDGYYCDYHSLPRPEIIAGHVCVVDGGHCGDGLSADEALSLAHDLIEKVLEMRRQTNPKKGN